MKAAALAGREDQARERIREVIVRGSLGDRYALSWLRERLDIA